MKYYHYHYLDKKSGQAIRIRSKKQPSQKTESKIRGWIVNEFVSDEYVDKIKEAYIKIGSNYDGPHPSNMHKFCMAAFPEIWYSGIHKLVYLGKTECSETEKWTFCSCL